MNHHTMKTVAQHDNMSVMPEHLLHILQAVPVLDMYIFLIAYIPKIGLVTADFLFSFVTFHLPSPDDAPHAAFVRTWLQTSCESNLNSLSGGAFPASLIRIVPSCCTETGLLVVALLLNLLVVSTVGSLPVCTSKLPKQSVSVEVSCLTKSSLGTVNEV